MLSGQPIIILRDNVERNTGKEAQRSNIMAAKAIAGAVRTTLGPRGMDKMLVGSTGDIVITNDGATILQEISVSTPAQRWSSKLQRPRMTRSATGLPRRLSSPAR